MRLNCQPKPSSGFDDDQLALAKAAGLHTLRPR